MIDKADIEKYFSWVPEDDRKAFSKDVSDVKEMLISPFLGREIETLITKEQSVGNYQVEFDATYLTSGIYIYRIQAGDFVDTKKMVLLR